MKIEIIELFNFQPEIIFAVLTDIPHHVDWMDEPPELVSQIDGPAKLGTKWEQNAERLGRKLVTLNTATSSRRIGGSGGNLKSLFRLKSC